MPELDAPLALLAELTHRCPLQCPYCSNPLELERSRAELDTDSWRRVLDEAAALGVLQVHFSGGEPLVRRDLDDLVRHASGVGLYSNLITSAVLLDAERTKALGAAGLDHVQISFQNTDDAAGDRVAGYKGAQRLKRVAAQHVRNVGLPLTVNAVVHRQNLAQLPAMIELAVELGAGRLEVAHVQYYGWALPNRAALFPTREQLDAATTTVEAARARLRGKVVIDYVVPDYHAEFPKACMGGWGRRFLNVTPSGKVLPCHAAETLPGFQFPSVRETSLASIWRDSDAFNRFRGTSWMSEPCRSCERQ
jgi:pyrroloquinoline quinone biosynthesis protein E